MRYYAIIFSFLFIASSAFAQEEIYFKSGDALRIDLVSIDGQEVIYKHWNTNKTEAFLTPLSEIEKLILEDGTILSEENNFGNENTRKAVKTKVDKDAIDPFEGMNPYKMGREDAKLYYSGYSGAGTWTIVSTLASPIGGLIVAASTSSTPPKEKRYGNLNKKLLNNSNYRRGYAQGCHKIKKKKVWGNFLIGMGINVLVFSMTLAAPN